MPNIIFTRDTMACIGNWVNINVMHLSIKHRETLLVNYIFSHHPYYKKASIPRWYNCDLLTILEGGDQLVLGKNTLTIGISRRTQVSSIEEFARNLFNR